MSETIPKINERLREERLRRHWSQQELADRLGTTRISVRRWEHATTTPNPYFRLKLTALFGKSAQELGLITSENIDQPQTQLETQCSILPLETIETVANRSQNNQEEEIPKGLIPNSAEILPQPVRQQRKLARRMVCVGVFGGTLAVALGGSLWKIQATVAALPVPMIKMLYSYRAGLLLYINDVSWSPDGGRIACAVGDNTIRILEAATGKAMLTYRGHRGYAECAQWAPHGAYVASASADRTVQVWDPNTGRCIITYRGHTQPVMYLAWSHDGTSIASGGKDSDIQVWDAATGKKISTYRGHTGTVWSIRWSPDDERIVSGGADGRVHVWESMTGQDYDPFRYEGPQTSTINEVDWSPDGRWIVSAHADSYVYLWDGSTGAQVLTYTSHTASVRTARWNPDGKYIASGGVDATVQIWDAVTGKRLFTYDKHTDQVLEVSWDPAGKRLASASMDHTLQICTMIE